MPIWAVDIVPWVSKLLGAFLIGYAVGLAHRYWQKLLDMI